MLRKILIGLGLFALLMIAVAMFWPKPKPQPAPRRPQQVRSWSGSERKLYKTSFLRHCEPPSPESCADRIELVSVSYQGLNQASADLTAEFEVEPGGQGQPRWLVKRAFAGYSGRQRYYDPRFSLSSGSGVYRATVTFRAVPTVLLGPTKQDSSGGDPASASSFQLVIYGPDGPFAIHLAAPAPSVPGHVFAEKGGSPGYSGRAPGPADALRIKLAQRRARGQQADPVTSARKKPAKRSTGKQSKKKR